MATKANKATTEVTTPDVVTPEVATPEAATPEAAEPKQYRFAAGVGYKGDVYQVGQSYPLSDEDAQALAHFIEQ